jgi:hypothetical protein
MKHLLLTFAATLTLIPFSVMAENLIVDAGFDEDVAQQCYDTCMPQKALHGSALTLADFQANHKSCEAQCATPTTENKTVAGDEKASSNQL